ncbi:Sodium/hydrogen exchanger 7 [Melipona quadrifasciata]|uniref:Sodium/hydrogen exchanger 7 n=1 Tax=Melipona quadrifasciata TaxID=166423 RepID=A0A0M9A6C3_9HYME|nr:Sodium/hydrogen exchanger 7 [Melipona quadrifasciata]
MAVRGDARIFLLVILCIFLLKSCNGAATDIELDAKAQLLHRLDSLNLLLYTFLLILTVLTIWTFKHRRLRFLHETGLAVIYGLIIGAIIRYGFTTSSTILHMPVVPDASSKYNQSVPPDTLWLRFPEDKGGGVIKNKTFAYSFRGEIYKQDNEIDLKATFDPEIFFNIILPPIIFHAGYSLKRKYFFRNLGAILMYALIGTSISAFVIGALMYVFVQLIPHLSASFTFLDTLYFGALISPTDPLTIISIFNDLHVDVNLYALVFGESVLNDAVAIVLSGSIQNYGERYQSGSGGFETVAFFQAFGDFVGIFSLSLFIGATMGCITALLTKFTRVRDFPLLESALFVLMSYSTFLIAEASDLTGNIHEKLTLFYSLLFFYYIGVSMFTFPKHHFDPGFIFAGFLCALLGRAANVYPLSFILNLARKPKISLNYQHMLFFAGLRGAMSFALAIRNTVSDARQAMLTTTSLIVILTVIFQGGATTQFLSWFNIPVGVDEEIEGLSHNGMRSSGGEGGFGDLDIRRERSPPYNSMQDGSLPGSGIKPNEKALLARIWGDFDTRYMKPLLTHSRPTLLETLPVCCTPLARILTTTQQMTQDEAVRKADSDSDFCLEDRELERRRTSIQPVSFHQPNLNYTINPCYQPNSTDASNPDEPYLGTVMGEVSPGPLPLHTRVALPGLVGKHL